MSPEGFEPIARTFLDREPFRTFTIKMKCGDLFEVDHRDAVRVAEGIGVFTAPGSILIFFDYESVSHFIDAPASDIPAAQS